MGSATLKPKRAKVVVDKEWVNTPSRWGVSTYGVTLIVNPTSMPFFGKVYSLDVEDDEKGNFVGCGIYNPSDNTCYYWSDFEMFQGVYLSKFIAHNGISDVRKLQKWGFKIDDSWLLWDTQLMAHILDSTRHSYGLKKLVKEDCSIIYPYYEDLTGKKSSKNHTTLDKLDVALVSEYNACDTYSTYKLYEKQLNQCEKSQEKQYYDKIEKSSAIVFEAMQSKGIRVDLGYLRTLKDSLEAQRKPLIEAITNELGPINLNSPKQLLEALNAKDIRPMLKKKPSTDKRALEAWKERPIVSSLLQYSEVSTLLSSFVEPYLERNQEVVHPRFNQTGTRTGRPSCSDPNLLQIPKRTKNGQLVRQMFIPKDGFVFGELDYKEGEPRMLAHLSGDKDMCRMFNDGTGFHDYFAKALNITRDKAKVFDLETYYRATKYGVARHLNCSLTDAQKRIDEAWNLFPNLYDWEQKILHEAKQNGYITSLMGRRIKVQDLDSNNEWKRSAAERQAMNNLAQGSLQEVTKLAMIAIHKENIDILAQVYDSLLIESQKELISQEMSTAINLMENSCQLQVPLVVTYAIGDNWAACHT